MSEVVHWYAHIIIFQSLISLIDTINWLLDSPSLNANIMKQFSWLTDKDSRPKYCRHMH